VEIVRQTKKYQALREADVAASTTHAVTVDPVAFKAYVAKRRAFFGRVEKLLGKQNYVALDYAELVRDPGAADRILSFLGLDRSVKLETKHRKQNPVLLQDKIANFEQVRTALSGTPHEIFLEDIYG
jgi:hypothetical protein